MSDPFVRLKKRRRIGKKSMAMTEDDDSAVDTAIYEKNYETGQKVLMPVRLDVQSEPAAAPDPAQKQDETTPFDIDMPEPDYGHNPPPKRHRSFYMQEFVARADLILQAILARETMDDKILCPGCAGVFGKWRCRDCVGGDVLCRACMRGRHFANPFHWIECWTGAYFRAAALWEVGVYFRLHHHQTPAVCASIQSQTKILERLQAQKDQKDFLENEPQPVPVFNAAMPDSEPEPEPVPDPDQEAAEDRSFMKILDQMLKGQNPDSILEETDTDLEGQDLDIDSFATAAGFEDYIQTIPVPDPEAANIYSADCAPEVPRHDALNNQYVRIVHTNGIHHLALMNCTCRGKESIVDDLFYAQMVPTSFERIRTLFTTAALDRFRYCNLEMKSSAYQFFQMLRRLTQPMNPSIVVNLYHELRRLSRLWRWVKKLKWGGYGHEPNETLDPKSAELGIFCPACPQVGVNMPDNWEEDENRWVYRRVFVTDGNFKADHVRQKGAADDMWLSDGSGMTTRQTQYKEFIKNALERSTVSCPKRRC